MDTRPIYDAGEPDDIVLAMAEATGRPVHVIQKDIDERIQKDASGNPIRDKKGRTRKFFTQAVLDKLAQDPRVAPIMARLAKERADKMAAAAKGQKRNAPSTLDTMFAPETSNPPPSRHSKPPTVPDSSRFYCRQPWPRSNPGSLSFPHSPAHIGQQP
jgi:hypothetical protein